jgi:hypothetical protein
MTGWAGYQFTDITGDDLPLDIAAQLLDMPEKDLRELVRITRLQPSGVIRMSSFSRQGRQPRAYSRAQLILISEALIALKEALGTG